MTKNETSPKTEQVRILIVDDHPSTAATLARALGQLGSAVEVISATNGSEALEKVKDKGVDILITDMIMPEMTGLELIEKLRDHPGGRPARTYLVTAYDVPGLKVTAQRLKVNEVLIKPVRPERIYEIVSRDIEEMKQSTQPNKNATVEKRKFKILVADDRPDNLTLLARYLEYEGYDHVDAQDGEEALIKAQDEMPDLILLDVDMPKKNGFAVLSEIRSNDNLKHIPIIILTAARLDSANVQTGLNLEADDYIAKPFDRHELMARIRTKLHEEEAVDVIPSRHDEISVLPEIGEELTPRYALRGVNFLARRGSSSKFRRPFHTRHHVQKPITPLVPQRRYLWLQTLLTIGLIVLTVGGVYILVRDALRLNHALGPVALTHYSIVGELADLQRAVLQMQLEVERELSAPNGDSKEMEKRYATIKIQFAYMVTDFKSPDSQLILDPASEQLLATLQSQLAATDLLMEKLPQASADELDPLLQEINNLLREMDIAVKQLYERRAQSQVTSLSEASRIAQSSQLSLILAGTALAIMGGLLLLITRRALNTELRQAHSRLQQEADRLQHLTGELQERTIELSNTNEQLQVELSERKRAEEKLVYTALHDPLTNLPNRVLFMDRLEHAMKRAERHKDFQFAVLYLDLDRFKVVNDSLGHNIGDLLLIESAHRLAACLRGEDTVARLGGDEFVILLEDIQGPMDATLVADRIQHDLALPHDLEDHKVFVSSSVGIVLSAARYERPEDVLRDSDIAMYRAKGQGRGHYEMFDTAMFERAMTRLELEGDLRKAIEHQEFVIHYQPIVELGARRIVGFEALIRWQHPTRGLVSPAEFIPTAEETGLIVPIGHWVLSEACRQVREWQVQFPVDPPLTISVNLSTRQCLQTDLVQKVAGVLQQSGLNASSLKLELTESMIVEDAESTSAMLSELRTLGVQVQIDDFGTGYSSLGYLQKLPIDTLKIDRTFISRIGNDGSGLEIVRTILALAHDLGMKVVAEGVETEDQLAKLKMMECEYGQGYLFTRPIDSLKAGAMLAESLAGEGASR